MSTISMEDLNELQVSALLQKAFVENPTVEQVSLQQVLIAEAVKRFPSAERATQIAQKIENAQGRYQFLLEHFRTHCETFAEEDLHYFAAQCDDWTNGGGHLLTDVLIIARDKKFNLNHGRMNPFQKHFSEQEGRIQKVAQLLGNIQVAVQEAEEMLSQARAGNEMHLPPPQFILSPDEADSLMAKAEEEGLLPASLEEESSDKAEGEEPDQEMEEPAVEDLPEPEEYPNPPPTPTEVALPEAEEVETETNTEPPEGENQDGFEEVPGLKDHLAARRAIQDGVNQPDGEPTPDLTEQEPLELTKPLDEEADPQEAELEADSGEALLEPDPIKDETVRELEAAEAEEEEEGLEPERKEEEPDQEEFAELEPDPDAGEGSTFIGSSKRPE